MLKNIITIFVATAALLVSVAKAEMGKDCRPCGNGRWRWEPPQQYVRFRRCYYGCPAVVTCGTTHWVLPCATTSCSWTSCPLPTTGVAPVTITTATTCSKCSITVNPLRCTTVVVCNPAKTSCAASFASVSSMTFSTITSAVTLIPTNTSSAQQGAAVSNYDGNLPLWIAIAIASVAFFGILA